MMRPIPIHMRMKYAILVVFDFTTKFPVKRTDFSSYIAIVTLTSHSATLYDL